MKFRDSKTFYGGFIKVKVLKLICIVISLSVIMTSCGRKSVSELKDAEAEKAIEHIMDSDKNKSIEITALYADLYLQAEKIKSEYFPHEIELAQSEIDEIESFLISKGYPVINSDAVYPDYLENSQSFYTFWNNASAGKEAKQSVIGISSSGGLFYTVFQYSDGVKYKIRICTEWDENNQPVITSEEQVEITDWDLINDTDFYYRNYLTGIACDDYLLIRLEQPDKELCNLNDKYIRPIGYSGNNMFVCEWTYRNYGELCMNDLLESFYKMENNEYFRGDNYPKLYEPYIHSYIPGELFENTIKPYFDITLSEFRKRCLYDSEKNIYPWQEVCCENVTVYPTVEPEVVGYRDNNDGTFTLTVNVRCNDFKTPCLFTHEVTIRTVGDTGHQYLSNRITYKSNFELPPNRPRLRSQRADV